MYNSITNLLLTNGVFNEDLTVNIGANSKTRKQPQLRQLIEEHTKFLQYDAPLKVRLHCILKQITTQPKCLGCGTVLKMRLDGIYRYTFADFCGSKCFATDDSIKDKRANTKLEKYGESGSPKNKEISAKRIKTNNERFGVDNPATLESSKLKRRMSILDKYGTHDNYIQTIKSKRIATNQSLYGVDNPATLPEFINKRMQTIIDKYGVDNVFKLEKFQLIAKERMNEIYGVEHALQHDESIDKFHNTMTKLYGGIHWHTCNMPNDSFDLINDKKWMEEKYLVDYLTMSDIADMLGISPSTVLKYMHLHGIEIDTASHGEKQLQIFITSLIPDIEIQFNDRTILKPKELDVYIPSLNLAFEYDGIFWHSDINGKNRHYHINKQTTCSEQGIRLVQIYDKEWAQQKSLVQSRIRNLLKKSHIVTYGRNTTVCDITPSQAKTFYECNHIQGSVGGSIHIGLQNKKTLELLSVMTLGKSRFATQYDYELIRFATKQDNNVVGGASKLFKYFIRTVNPSSVISYSDRRWNTGKVYELLGFDYIKTSTPNYKYFKPTQSHILFSRQMFQKHKLESKLDTFDPLLTEWENMVNNGYDRIWDCGNDVFVWNA